MMNHASFLKHWDDFWTTGLWCPPLSKAVEGLSAEQAAWKPSPDRHSIWQLVHHLIFWREQATAVVRAVAPATEAETARRNWEPPAAITEPAWAATRRALEASQLLVRAAILAPGADHDSFIKLIPHDSYHLGQIMQLRAMQGLAPID